MKKRDKLLAKILRSSKVEISAEKVAYYNKRSNLIAYLNDKVAEQDWHGVSDAANDLRVLEAAQPRS